MTGSSTQSVDMPRRYLVPGAGAFPLWEEPEAVNPLVAQFLEEGD